MKRRYWIGLGVIASSTLIALTVALTRTPPEPGFLEKYPRFHMANLNKAYTPRNFWKGRDSGIRMFTFQGDFTDVVEDARERLRGHGWAESHWGVGHAFTRGEEVITIIEGRSMWVPDPHFKHQGQPIYGRHVVDAKGAALYKIEADDVRGWVTIDHSWSQEQGIIERFSNLFRRDVPPQSAVTVKRAPPAP